ncbi:hypothetical protein AA309_08795 [Microvirga vignae]|uniref:Uncharacterized protein n=1 Tax=Microvirga vignae TaxID=1225564 RepID=A0A0H1RLB5_9HYPH|nr:hypothetical protein [Microvirga vignae]KLK93417.1 hypothetical protein AA309_08795 [Microvirga vignae]
MAKAKMFSNAFAKITGSLSSASSSASSLADGPTGDAAKQPAPTPNALSTDTNSKMQTMIGGEATAVGESTSASGEVTTRTFDKGAVKISFGSAEFTAAAKTTGGDPTYAAADSYASASGADIFLTRTKVSSYNGQEALQTYSGETSRTVYLAIDIEKVDLPRGPITVDKTIEKGDPPTALPSDGNLAILDVDAKAEAEHTYIGTDASALSMEDSLSTVSAIVITEVA